MAFFQGVGTIPGVKQAVSSGLLVDTDVVDVLEDFDANKYEIELTDWTAHETGTVRTLADLADPLAIERLDPVHYLLEGDTVTPTSSGTRVITSTSGLGTGELGEGTLS
jgi:hypothetical protein